MMKRFLYLYSLVIVFILFANPFCTAQIVHSDYSLDSENKTFKIDSTSLVEYTAYNKVFLVGDEEVVGKNKFVTGEIKWNKSDSIQPLKALIIISTRKFVTDNETRDEDAREILNVSQHPEIRFELSGLEGFKPLNLIDKINSEKEDSLIVSGTLNINGITKEIQFPVKMKINNEKITVEGITNIKYSDFNMEPPTAGWIVKRATDDLTLKAFISAIRVR